MGKKLGRYLWAEEPMVVMAFKVPIADFEACANLARKRGLKSAAALARELVIEDLYRAGYRDTPVLGPPKG
jgi:hypothetical protein